MPCYKPNLAYVYGTTANGKQAIKFIGKGTNVPPGMTKIISVPCGQCLGCRLDYSREWANRMQLELTYHSSSYFVTLTYDPSHVPISYHCSNKLTGEALEMPTLSKRDVQLFMKRLRKSTGQSIRYYISGEYGDKTYRPHYHAILFGLSLDDLQFFKRSGQGFDYYLSPKLQKIWGKGQILITQVTWDTCAYTARYMLKKLKGEGAQYYDEVNITPPFSVMSRRPGIGSQYFIDNPDIYKYDYINIPTLSGGERIYPPRFYDRLYDSINPDHLAALKAVRRFKAENKLQFKLSRTSLDEFQLLAAEETAACDKTRILNERSMKNA